MKMAKGKQSEVAKLAKRVSALERLEKEERRAAPARPEDVVARQAMRGERPDFLRVARGNANFEEPVRRDLERLGGRSRSDLVGDRDRGASSPLTQARRRK